MIEFPEEPRAGSSSQPTPGPRRAAGAAGEAEDWLRRELAFLHRVERRILRRERWRQEAWRAVAVAAILAVFALCWYLAALATDSAHGSCAGKATTTAAAAHDSTAKRSGTAASCGS